MTALVEAAVPVAASPLADARAQLREAADLLGLDQGMHDMLATPRRETTVLAVERVAQAHRQRGLYP